MYCPFCGSDPYEYVDVGLGGKGQPVAVTCCEMGIEYFDPRSQGETVEISRDEFNNIAATYTALRHLGMTPSDGSY